MKSLLNYFQRFGISLKPVYDVLSIALTPYHGNAKEVLPGGRGPDVAPLVADESLQVLVARQAVDDVHGVLGKLSAPELGQQVDEAQVDGQAG